MTKSVSSAPSRARRSTKKSFGFFTGAQDKKQSAKEGWHSDITFEPVPSDYAILRLTELPKTVVVRIVLSSLFSDPSPPPGFQPSNSSIPKQANG